VTCQVRKIARDTNQPLVEKSPPMKISDLLILCSLLYGRNNEKAVIDRCLLTFQWQSLGRIGETTSLELRDFNFVEEATCMEVDLTRFKVDLQQVDQPAYCYVIHQISSV